MTRKKRDSHDMPLVPEPEFEDAMRSLLNAPKAKVDESLAAMQASNKRRREAKKLSPSG